jgi:hypothetical protein
MGDIEKLDVKNIIEINEIRQILSKLKRKDLLTVMDQVCGAADKRLNNEVWDKKDPPIEEDEGEPDLESDTDDDELVCDE